MQIVGRDAYGNFPVSRKVMTIRGVIRSGNSGGPVVDAQGRVITTVFAQRVGTDGGYGVPNSAVRAALAKAGSTLRRHVLHRPLELEQQVERGLGLLERRDHVDPRDPAAQRREQLARERQPRRGRVGPGVTQRSQHVVRNRDPRHLVVEPQRHRV